MTIRRIATNSAWLLIDRIIRLGGGLGLVIWMARTVGPESFGPFGFASAIAGITAAIGTLGLQSVVMRDVVRNHEGNQLDALSAAFLLRLVASVLLFAAAGISVLLLRGTSDSTVILTLILAAAILPQALDVLEWCLLSHERARLVTLTRTSVFALFAAIRAGIILTHGTVEAFALTIPAEALSGAAALFFVARRDDIRVAVMRAQPERIRAYALAALPLVGTAIFVQVYMRADQLMVMELLGNTEAGLYSAAVRISEAWNFIPVAAMLAMAPRLTAAHRRSDSEFMHLLSRVIGTLAGASIIFALVVWLYADRIIVAVYGRDYKAAATALGIHVFSSVLVTIGVASAPFFVNKELFGIAMLQTAIGGALNVGLNIVLIPRLGIAGAAVATVIAYAFSAVLLNAAFRPTRTLFRFQVFPAWRPR